MSKFQSQAMPQAAEPPELRDNQENAAAPPRRREFHDMRFQVVDRAT
jgi:hypothetical protein